MPLVAVPDIDLIQARLPLIFPEGLEDRVYCIREMSAATIFTMFYLDAVDGTGRYMRPSQVTLMSDTQAARRTEAERTAFAHATLTRKKGEQLQPPADRWYKDNTREPIRDETLGDGLIKYGAVVAIEVPTTSDKPRYALQKEFAALFLADETAFPALCDAWRSRHFSKSALNRIKIAQHGALARQSGVVVQLPNSSQTFQMAPGDSSVLTKAFVETFATKFLAQPIALFISESGNKKSKYMDDLLQKLGIVLDQARLLPDVLLLDIGNDPHRLVFAEIVATDGPIREERKKEFLAIAKAAGFEEQDCSFVTVFAHRDSAPFKKSVNSLAWGTFAWFVNEPDCLVVFSSDSQKPLGERL